MGCASLGKTGDRSPHLPESPALTPATLNLLQTFSRAIRKLLEQSELQGGSEDAWHLPKGEKIRSESAVWKTSTLSSEISLTAGHRTRHNEGKQPGWGGVSACPQSWPLGMAFPKGANPWLAPLPRSEMLRHPQNYPRVRPATSTEPLNPLPASMPLHTAHSGEAAQDFRCPWGEKSSQQWVFAFGNGWVLGTSPPTARGEREWAARQAPCTILNCQLYFCLLQAGVPQEKKRSIIKTQAVRFFWFSQQLDDSL